MANWFTQFKGPGGGSGMQSYRMALDAGYSPQQIAAAAPSSGLSVGWRLRDTIGTINAASAAAQAQSQAASQAQAQAQSYQNQLSSYKSQLDDYSRRFTDVNNQYQTALSGKAAAEGLATEWEGKWNKSQTDYEAAKRLADSYKEEAVSRQLAGLQSGRTVQGAQSLPRVGLAGGAGAISKAAMDKEDALAIEKKISAEDSVLSRTGPVVARIGGSSAPSGISEGKRALTSGASGGHYASRFG
jgi:hypothetical protein